MENIKGKMYLMRMAKLEDNILYIHYINLLTSKTINPNPSFDLARFSCSFIEDLDDELWPTENDLNDYEIGRLLNAWTINDVGESLMDIEGFELYINIARFFRKKTPESQIKRKF